MTRRQNITVQIDKDIVRKAKVLAARRGASVSGLLAAQIELLARSEDEYELARRQALELIATGFHLGGVRARRDDLHDR